MPSKNKKKKEEKQKQNRQKEKQKDIKLLIILILALILVNYPFLDRQLENFLNLNQQMHVDRIIDGDTIESNRTSIRLLGINTPERGEFFYEEGKEFLEREILGKNMTLEFIGGKYDKYRRILAYLFFNNTNINIKMVENGYANYYFYSGKDKYSDELLDAWEMCIDNNKNLCEKSDDVCSPCIKISSDSINNSCSFSCDITNWEIKGEGREKFIFSEQVLEPGANSKFALDLTNTGGSLFLRDEKGKLVEWKE